MIHFYLYQNFLKNLNIYFFKRAKSILVIADHDNNNITLSTRKLLTAVKQIGGDITILVAGTNCHLAAKPVAKAARIERFKRVLVANNEAFQGFPDEHLAKLIVTLQQQYSFTHIIAGASTFGKTLIPTVAAKHSLNAITDVIEIKGPDTFVRPIYTGNAYVTFKVKDPVKIMTIRENMFEACSLQEDTCFESRLARIFKQIKLKDILSTKNKLKFQHKRILNLDKSLKEWKTRIDHGIPIQSSTLEYNLGLKSVTRKIRRRHREGPNLLEATIIICGGMGLKYKENFDLLYELADLLNAAVGASGAAVNSGLALRDIEIGQNGKIVSPDLYIAIGVSGSNQHLVGMKNSKTIIAINRDSKAPIHKIADYCLVRDLFKVVPQLITTLKGDKSKSLVELFFP